MRTLYQLWVALLCLLPLSGFADGNNHFPVTQSFAGQSLQLNGMGSRNKWMIHLYDAGLYLKGKQSDAATILAANEPMAMRLVITSSMITSEKMEGAVREGFKKSPARSDISREIEQLIAVFKTRIKVGDVYDFVYRPSSMAVIKNGAAAANIAGVDFKQAFFGIWLGNNPAQASLKKALLGQ